MPANKKSAPSEKKSISIHGNATGNDVIIGDHKTVNKTTIIQKFFNIFKSDSETLEQRNRRILINHVENAWIKGVLDASLHGAALLDLGIKQDPEAVTKYPWAIKKESTNETLPAGTSMLDIFEKIGMGRSLLILGAPGSGKTTMLLELARQLIARAREDVTYPIPMVFNLASWTEKLSLADWLAQELNNLYSVPRKTAPDWVKGNKLLLLLDGLDEVRQESRSKCVEAINEFRKEHGLTSLAVCSRSQDYADLNAKLSFEGAIEVQPLTQKQITEFFNLFGKEMAGIKQVLKKDSALREMAETPLFLSIMFMAYRDKREVDILVSGDEKAKHMHLFDKYIELMVNRRVSIHKYISEQKTLIWLSWLAYKMNEEGSTFFKIEFIKREWLNTSTQKILARSVVVLFFLIPILFTGQAVYSWIEDKFIAAIIAFIFISGVLRFTLFTRGAEDPIENIQWDYRKVLNKKDLVESVVIGSITGLVMWLQTKLALVFLATFLGTTVCYLVLTGFTFSKIRLPKVFEGLTKSLRHMITTWVIVTGLIYFVTSNFMISCINGVWYSMMFGGVAVINHYVLRLFLWLNNSIPLNLVPFLDHCVDLIFLRRVGGGYIFIHRLLMEHFAEMYVETNQKQL